MATLPILEGMTGRSQNRSIMMMCNWSVETDNQARPTTDGRKHCWGWGRVIHVLVVFISRDHGMGIFIYHSHGIGAFHDLWDGHFLITVLVG